MKDIIYKFTFILIAIIFVGTDVFAQVTIAPTNLFIDSRTKFGTYLVINGSNESQEINVDFLFGYTVSNEDGSRKVVYEDDEKAAEYSAANWVRAFPKSFTLAPGQRQVVRLRVVAPNDLADGTYWSRIRTTSSPVSTPVEVQSNEAITARVGIEIAQVTGLYYKKGDVTTGIDITDMSTKMGDDGVLEVLADIKRTGNSPFLGSITANILDTDGNVVTTSFVSTTIFFDGKYKHEIDLSTVQTGNYQVELKFDSRRGDVSSNEIVQMQPVSKIISFTKS